MTKFLAAALLATVFLVGESHALEDTPENRMAQIERYLDIMPPDEMLDEIVENVANNMQGVDPDQFRKLMSEYLDVDAYTEIMKAAMARHFTADELEAMADFYSSPAGKSAMGKMGAYMGDVMPAALAEVQKAMARMQADEAAAD